MEKNLTAHSIVIINTGISPSLFNAFWLVNNGILREEELTGNHVFTNQHVEINTDRFVLVVNGNSFQLTAKNGVNDLGYCIENILNKLIDSTPKTIHISAGVNFNWFITPEDGNYSKLSKKLFYNNESDLYKHFDKDGASFGGYMSCDFEKARMKLDVKPVIIGNSNQDVKGAIHYNFNFHYDVPMDNRNESLKTYINNWNKFYQESEKIIQSI